MGRETSLLATIHQQHGCFHCFTIVVVTTTCFDVGFVGFEDIPYITQKRKSRSNGIYACLRTHGFEIADVWRSNICNPINKYTLKETPAINQKNFHKSDGAARSTSS